MELHNLKLNVNREDSEVINKMRKGGNIPPLSMPSNMLYELHGRIIRHQAMVMLRSVDLNG
jgi:hypothetical protein